MSFARARAWYAPALLCLACAVPLWTQAALININTAGSTELETLPGIGPSKASAIIEYRTLNGPFARIEDIQNVSGIGPSTYANIASLITVGETGDSSGGSSTVATSSEPILGAAGTYVPPPSSFTLDIGPDISGLIEVPLQFAATLKTKGGADSAATVRWSFGDGSHTEGKIVEKVFTYPGTYLVTARASNGEAVATDDAIVRIGKAHVRIVSVSQEGVTIANDAPERLDLSGWRLSAGSSRFFIPEGTMLLPKSEVFFPAIITRLPLHTEVELWYPRGTLATRFIMQALAETKPSVESASSHMVQTVEPLAADSHDSPFVPAYVPETAVAPVAANVLAAAGAPLSAPQAAELKEDTERFAFSDLLRSPWTIGFLGVLVLAGGALMIL